jgi:hemolysin III
MMGVAHAQSRRPWSRGEEIANSISHGIGLLAALIAVQLLLAESARRGGAQSVTRSGVFGLTILLVYLASTLFHALPDGRTKRAFEVPDNAAVFLLIAGTYTPLTLGVLRGPWGLSLFALVWTLAVVGVLLTAVGDLRYPVTSASLCLGMGWLFLVALRPIARTMPLPGLLLILAGGLAYTAGLAFGAARQLSYHHLVWHLFVLLGTGCHFLAILWYAT